MTEMILISVVCMLFTEARVASAALQIMSESLQIGPILHINEASLKKWQLQNQHGSQFQEIIIETFPVKFCPESDFLFPKSNKMKDVKY